jgi:uncharacterized protein with PQ loop repeat
MRMKETVAWLFGMGLVSNIGLFLPQAAKIWKAKSGKHVSFATFAGFNVLQALALLHAYLQRDPFLFVGMIATFLSCLAVTVAAFIYRKQ